MRNLPRPKGGKKKENIDYFQKLQFCGCSGNVRVLQKASIKNYISSEMSNFIAAADMVATVQCLSKTIDDGIYVPNNFILHRYRFF